MGMGARDEQTDSVSKTKSVLGKPLFLRALYEILYG